MKTRIQALAFSIIYVSLVFAQEERVKGNGPSGILKPLSLFEKKLVKVVEKARKATISIENWRKDGKGNLRMVSGGSGVIISSRGHALTNQHVVNKADRLVSILWNGRRISTEVVGRDPRGDVVVIRLKFPRNKKPRFSYAKVEPGPSRRLKPGDIVIATGNPFFLARDGDPVVTIGIVSGLGRVSGGTMVYGSAIQHDARINPGNSGGPLWDINGKLVGINGRISSSGVTSPLGPSSTGVGYAIPISQVYNFLSQMLGGAEMISHADQVFGVKVETFRDEKGRDAGALVTDIRPMSPASRAKGYGSRGRGLKPGDVIVKIIYKGKTYSIKTATGYMNLMTTIPAGTKITVVVKRGKRFVRFPNVKLPSEKTMKRK